MSKESYDSWRWARSAALVDERVVEAHVVVPELLGAAVGEVAQRKEQPLAGHHRLVAVGVDGHVEGDGELVAEAVAGAGHVAGGHVRPGEPLVGGVAEEEGLLKADVEDAGDAGDGEEVRGAGGAAHQAVLQTEAVAADALQKGPRVGGGLREEHAQVGRGRGQGGGGVGHGGVGGRDGGEETAVVTVQRGSRGELCGRGTAGTATTSTANANASQSTGTATAPEEPSPVLVIECQPLEGGQRRHVRLTVVDDVPHRLQVEAEGVGKADNLLAARRPRRRLARLQRGRPNEAHRWTAAVVIAITIAVLLNVQLIIIFIVRPLFRNFEVIFAAAYGYYRFSFSFSFALILGGEELQDSVGGQVGGSGVRVTAVGVVITIVECNPWSTTAITAAERLGAAVHRSTGVGGGGSGGGGQRGEGKEAAFRFSGGVHRSSVHVSLLLNEVVVGGVREFRLGKLTSGREDEFSGGDWDGGGGGGKRKDQIEAVNVSTAAAVRQIADG
ncbi:hypothetical protein TYRP_022818 [Tyrophagus putrescentiae]|nr:hypothetical protein TYRP_022818 [Tyrophagus putrescentiae]